MNKGLMLSPEQVDIAITGRCNLACQYCFYADEMTARADLPTERWLAFFAELGKLGVMRVTLTGGEVFTRRDFFTLLDGVIANHMRYSLLTNGTLVTDKVIAEFEQGKRRKRLESVQVSIDGSTAEIHDQSRPHSFERAIRGLKLMLKAGFPMTVRVTINRRNADDLENIAHLLLEEVGLAAFTTNEAYPCGKVDRTGDITLTPAQRQQVMDALATLEEKYPGRISAQAGPEVYVKEFARMDRLLSEGQTSLPGRGCLTACGGVFNKLAVLHDGTLVPCHNLSSLHLGMAGVDDLQKVWQDHPMMIALRERRSIPLSSLETCKECRYQGFCTGGCPGGAVFINDDMNSRNPMDCYRVLRGEDPWFSLANGSQTANPIKAEVG